jgi:hypothetical protein
VALWPLDDRWPRCFGPGSRRELPDRAEARAAAALPALPIGRLTLMNGGDFGADDPRVVFAVGSGARCVKSPLDGKAGPY